MTPIEPTKAKALIDEEELEECEDEEEDEEDEEEEGEETPSILRMVNIIHLHNFLSVNNL